MDEDNENEDVIHDDEIFIDEDGDVEFDDMGNVENNEGERRPFDVNLPPAHQYLQLNGNDELAHNLEDEEPGKVITVSILEMPIVLLPMQLLPFHTDYPLLVSQLQHAARENKYIALKPKLDNVDTDIATLIQIRSLHENDGGLSVQAIGRQRCRIFNRHSAINGMPYAEVQVLEEKELPSFSHMLMPISFSRLQLEKVDGRFFFGGLPYFAAMTSHSHQTLRMSLTKHYVTEIAKWLYGWHVYDKVKRVLSQGNTSFSYWVAANLPVDMETRLRLLDQSCTDRRLREEYYIINQIDLIVCKSCGTVLGQMSHMINVSTDGNSAHYVNPGGYVHDLFTLSEVSSTVGYGVPSSECSWFPGYMWTIHECERCRQHVGWRFTSTTLTPSSFFGLTRRAIRPADSRHPDTSNIQRIEQLAIV
ncbi:unnamed protein product [Thelazia callipaeda]|uniref:Protein cereblon n=1 Tax=Thelazia callipaeda TaxID=103827 RepID=A0A0N5CZA8_THECL|nr:unnamed protein product [Thelazia callipaeda]